EKARPGDTVLVAPGEYRELVRAKEGGALVSREPHAAVLRAAGGGMAVLVEGVRKGSIAGFRIAGDNRSPMAVGVQVRDASPELENLVISGASSAGIEVLGDAAPVIVSSQVVGNAGAGIVLRDRAAPRLARNVIGGSGKGAMARPALEIHDDAAPVLEGNTFLSDGAEAIWAPAPGIDSAVLERNLFGWQGTARRKVRVIPK